MGSIIGGIIGGVGSLIGSGVERKADKAGAQQALTGYNYLSGANGVQSFVNNGNAANSSANALLTGGPNSGAAKSAFSNYLNSTGYNFQKQQGMASITGSAAAHGLLGSGSTGKALAAYGNNLASTGFNNYLGQLNTQAAQGLTAADMIGRAGTQGGGNAGKLTAAGGQAVGTADSAAANQFSGAGGGDFISNLFGSIF